MNSFEPDTDFPLEIAPDEEREGFRLQIINPDAGIPERAVILVIGEKHRIVKMRDALTQEIVYVHQIKRLQDGQWFFSDGTFHTDMKVAVSFGKLTKDFEP